jgi:hypothetical protein
LVAFQRLEPITSLAKHGLKLLVAERIEFKPMAQLGQCGRTRGGRGFR